MAAKRREKTGRISVTGWIDERLKERIAAFLEKYPTVRSESTLVTDALQDYLEDAERFGIDVNHKPRRKGRNNHD